MLFKNDVSPKTIASHIAHASALSSNLSPSTSKAQESVSPFTLSTLHGYTVTASLETITTLSQSPDISIIELDSTITLPSFNPQPQRRRAVQLSPPWGLRRISHRVVDSTTPNEYVYTPTSGTYVYILDTGVRITHTAFQGNAVCGYNALTQTVGSGCEDLNGHGTHVAGTASSQTYGVVRFAGIVAVKILGDSGSSSVSTIIRGIEWTLSDINSRSRNGKATALLAIGGSRSAALNAAVAAASNSGLFFAVAAGNSNTNAANYSPASEPSACTVAATTPDDLKTSASNWGAVVDLFAPGANIIGPWITSDTAVSTISGTSSAAAHVAGLGSYFLALEGPRGAVALCERLRAVGTNVGLSAPLIYNLSGL